VGRRAREERPVARDGCWNFGNLYFSLPNARSVPVKKLVQAGSGSGLLTTPSSATAVSQSPTGGVSRGDLRSAARRGQETRAEHPPTENQEAIPVPFLMTRYGDNQNARPLTHSIRSRRRFQSSGSEQWLVLVP